MANLLPSGFSASLMNTTGQLMKRSKPVYEHDAKVLALWMVEQSLSPEHFTRTHAIAYLSYLHEKYQGATVKRMMSVARNIFREQVRLELRTSNPFEDIKGIPKGRNETPHMALTKQQASEFLASIDQSTHIGTRDYALVSLLLRTGIRRSECAALTIGDLGIDQGYHIATIQHGKGDKRRLAKIPVDVFRHIERAVRDVYPETPAPRDPLFVQFDRWDRPTGKQISDKLIERVVKAYGAKSGLPGLTPHGLRATFAQLAREGGAELTVVQFAMGHEDPRTTERYWTRKVNLDNNAVDYIHL